METNFSKPAAWALKQMGSQNLEIAQVLIGRKFNDLSLLALALTHKSCSKSCNRSNERLEFLGDALLNRAVEDHLAKNFPAVTGSLFGRMRSRLRSNHLLGFIADQSGFACILRTSGYGIENLNDRKGIRTKMLADLFEAIVAALFFDGGSEAIECFLEQTLFPMSKEVLESLDKPLLACFELDH